ncbi:MAG: PqqD family protein [Endomicrobiaceae bacterium]|nr:PqqD family protein [Endomicrobiaceae bacterium]
MKYAIKKGVLWQEVDGEIVIVAPKQDPMYLNESGSIVWKLIDTGMGETKIIDKISGEYEEDRKLIEKDVKAIITDLIKNKCIELKK